MAILTAAQLKASREAAQAGVSSLSDTDVNLAITEAEALLYSPVVLDYRVEVSETSLTTRGSGTQALYLPEHAQSISAVTSSGTALPVTGYYIGARGWVLIRRAGFPYNYLDAYAPLQGQWLEGAAITLTGVFGFATNDRRYILAQKAVRLLAIEQLRQNFTTSSANMPSPAGAYMTGYSSESASFSFYTPRDMITGDARITALIDQIGRRPFSSDKALRSYPMQTETYNGALWDLPTP